MSAYTDAVARGLEGLTAISTGLCPGCETCADAFDMPLAEFSDAWRACNVEDESHFSWCPCDICGTTLGGDREVWHALDANYQDTPIADRVIRHFHNVCTDCVLYLANGDEPSMWRRSSSSPLDGDA